MMHAQHFCRAAHRAKPRNLIRGAHFVPILHLIPRREDICKYLRGCAQTLFNITNCVRMCKSPF
jgi:hypothetical protein